VTQAFFLNTRVAPFDQVDVRRALNYAANRATIVEANGGADVAQPTCQILPPDFPGYGPYCPYTAGPTSSGSWTSPDLAKARALVARSGTRGMKVTVWAWSAAPEFNRYAVELLRALGFRTSMKRVADNYFGAVGDSRNRAQIGFFGWQPDYPTASSYFRSLFTCASFLPADPANSNASEFCDPSIDRLIERALNVQTTNPAAARALWERVDREVVDQAPWLPLYTPKSFNVLSKRVGNYQYNPSGFGMLVDQLWVR
jgi:peptide/nickel transport system substrate-binding protein